jgi:hypothetical protein
MVDNEAKLVFWLRSCMYGNHIHSREKVVERLRETSRFDFFSPLENKKISLPIIPRRVLRFAMSNWVAILLLSPRPKTFG